MSKSTMKVWKESSGNVAKIEHVNGKFGVQALPVGEYIITPVGYYSGDDEIDAARYRKLRAWMGSNVAEGWEEVSRLGGICSWMGWQHMDAALDGLGECNVGMCEKSRNPPVVYDGDDGFGL